MTFALHLFCPWAPRITYLTKKQSTVRVCERACRSAAAARRSSDWWSPSRWKYIAPCWVPSGFLCATRPHALFFFLAANQLPTADVNLALVEKYLSVQTHPTWQRRSWIRKQNVLLFFFFAQTNQLLVAMNVVKPNLEVQNVSFPTSESSFCSLVTLC